tara:strand:- start:1800 stop:2534 length:735 start_codon:yes stop_codon:yes gene_type:complete
MGALKKKLKKQNKKQASNKMLGAASRENTMTSPFTSISAAKVMKQPPTQEERTLINSIFDGTNPHDRYGNIHSWCEIDGKVKDPSPVKEYLEINALLLGLDRERPYYEPYSKEKCEQLLKLTKMKWERHPESFKELCFNKPQAGECYYNALALSLKNKNAKVQFGRMGYYYKNSNKYFVVWGENNSEVWERDTNLMIKLFMKAVKKRNKKLRLLLERSPRTDEEITGMRDVWHGRCNSMEAKDH